MFLTNPTPAALPAGRHREVEGEWRLTEDDDTTCNLKTYQWDDFQSETKENNAHLKSVWAPMQSGQWHSGSHTNRRIHHLCTKDQTTLYKYMWQEHSKCALKCNTKWILPSLFIVIGIVWTVCSFTHELVSICSSREVREKLLKPESQNRGKCLRSCSVNDISPWHKQ